MVKYDEYESDNVTCTILEIGLKLVGAPREACKVRDAQIQTTSTLDVAGLGREIFGVGRWRLSQSFSEAVGKLATLR